MTPIGHRVIRVRRDLLYDHKGHGVLCGRFDLVYDLNVHGVIRGRRDLLYDPKGHRIHFWSVWPRFMTPKGPGVTRGRRDLLYMTHKATMNFVVGMT